MNICLLSWKMFKSEQYYLIYTTICCWYNEFMSLENISHIYKGLLTRNRAYASFRKDELQLISEDIRGYIQNQSKENRVILDPMSGYGGSMVHFGCLGYKTHNIELNPPSYYWQLLIHPQNKGVFLNLIFDIQASLNRLPQIREKFSSAGDVFSVESIKLLKKIYQYIYQYTNDEELTIAFLLPFVSRFANYRRENHQQRTNITHFVIGGFCSFEGWQVDFKNYLSSVSSLLNSLEFLADDHTIELNNINNIEEGSFSFFVTSPPYPNYRDYSKIFIIENWFLEHVLKKNVTNFSNMIGSSTVKKKVIGEIKSRSAQEFLNQLLEKAQKLPLKQRHDIERYYHKYFSIYFYSIQEAYENINKVLGQDALGYIVVNDNITRDILIPVAKSVRDNFEMMDFNVETIEESQISHYGNIAPSAKRINSRHTRHILKIWK